MYMEKQLRKLANPYVQSIIMNQEIVPGGTEKEYMDHLASKGSMQLLRVAGVLLIVILLGLVPVHTAHYRRIDISLPRDIANARTLWIMHQHGVIPTHPPLFLKNITVAAEGRRCRGQRYAHGVRVAKGVLAKMDEYRPSTCPRLDLPSPIRIGFKYGNPMIITP